MHKRFESPITGRFLGVDPALNARRASRRPQNWNRYSYAMGNPLKYVDPDGREAIVFIVGPALGDWKTWWGHAALWVNAGGKSRGVSEGGSYGFERGVRGFLRGYLGEGRKVSMYVLRTTPEQDKKMYDFLKVPGGGTSTEGLGRATMTTNNCVAAVCNTLQQGGVAAPGDDLSGAVSGLQRPGELLESLESGSLSGLVGAQIDFDPAAEEEAEKQLSLDQHGSVFGNAMRCSRAGYGNKTGNFCQ